MSGKLSFSEDVCRSVTLHETQKPRVGRQMHEKPWRRRRPAVEEDVGGGSQPMPSSGRRTGPARKPAGRQQDLKSCYKLRGEVLSAFLRHTRRLTSMNSKRLEAARKKAPLHRRRNAASRLSAWSTCSTPGSITLYRTSPAKRHQRGVGKLTKACVNAP